MPNDRLTEEGENVLTFLEPYLTGGIPEESAQLLGRRSRFH